MWVCANRRAIACGETISFNYNGANLREGSLQHVNMRDAILERAYRTEAGFKNARG